MTSPPKAVDYTEKLETVAQTPDQTILFALVIQPIQHEKLPFSVLLVRLEHPAVQGPHKVNNQCIADILVLAS